MKIDITNDYIKDVYDEIEEEEHAEEELEAQLIAEGKLIIEEEEYEPEEEYDLSDDEDKKLGKQYHKEKNNKKSSKMTLLDFNKKVDEEVKANEPKKFISKRSIDKKKSNSMNDIGIVKRKFNPRNPPYNFVHKEKKDIEIINLEEFPKL